MKEVYFDYKDCLLRTHVLLQEIKEIAGNKAYLHARKRLAQLYVLCKYGPSYPTLDVYKMMMAKAEVYMMYIKGSNLAKFTIEGFDGTINYINDNFWVEPQWFGLPIKEIKDMSLYEFSKYAESRRDPEEEEPMPEEPEQDENNFFQFDMDDWEDLDWHDNGNNPWEF